VTSDVDALVELSRVLVSAAYRSLEAASTEVTLPQFRAIAVLFRFGPCTSNGLASALDQHPSTVSRLCDRLVAEGWVTRRTKDDNRREVELELTPTGTAIAEEVFAARARELEQLLTKLPASSRRELSALLPQLLRAAEDTLPGARFAWAV
jgi:DNA-binding MarR family transcriptional regulator